MTFVRYATRIQLHMRCHFRVISCSSRRLQIVERRLQQDYTTIILQQTHRRTSLIRLSLYILKRNMDLINLKSSREHTAHSQHACYTSKQTRYHVSVISHQPAYLMFRTASEPMFPALKFRLSHLHPRDAPCAKPSRKPLPDHHPVLDTKRLGWPL